MIENVEEIIRKRGHTMTTKQNATALHEEWYGKPYYSVDAYLKNTFHEKLYRIALNGGMSCPNRDGKIHTRGCIFCSQGGSGDFAQAPTLSITEQIEQGKQLVSQKYSGSHYIAYFQAYTNTYGPVDYLRQIFMEAITHPDVVILSIATRPDCLDKEILDLLSELNTIKPVWIELGLQTIHEESAAFIRRGYPLSCFEQAVSSLKERGINIIAHTILGLPHETKQQMLETVEYVANLNIFGIKLQLLHILKDTDLADYYAKHPFPFFSLEEYTDFITEIISRLPTDLVIHRLTGDGPKSLLIEPQWSRNKKLVLNTIHHKLKEKKIRQGCCRIDK